MRYRLTIHLEETFGTDAPDGAFTLYSFNIKHDPYMHPELITACLECGVDGGEHDDSYDHEYKPLRGLFLSYFKHGGVVWDVQGELSHYPDFRWDGVSYAGFLAVNEGFDIPDDELWESARAYCKEYTLWANGEMYGYTLETVNVDVCNLGYNHEESEILDSCGGFIGDNHLMREVADVLKHHNIAEEDLEVIDNAYSGIDSLQIYALEV